MSSDGTRNGIAGDPNHTARGETEFEATARRGSPLPDVDDVERFRQIVARE